MKKQTLLLAGLAALCAFPAAAQPISVPVSFSGLDLTSVAGKSILDRRIAQAARSICGSFDSRDLAAVSANRKCMTTTLAQAQPRVIMAVAAASRPSTQIAAAR